MNIKVTLSVRWFDHITYPKLQTKLQIRYLGKFYTPYKCIREKKKPKAGLPSVPRHSKPLYPGVLGFRAKYLTTLRRADMRPNW